MRNRWRKIKNVKRGVKRMKGNGDEVGVRENGCKDCWGLGKMKGNRGSKDD